MTTILSKLTQVPSSALHFVRDAFDELKKVSWPDRQVTVRYTIIVMVSSLAIGLLIGGLDYLFTMLLETVVRRI